MLGHCGSCFNDVFVVRDFWGQHLLHGHMVKYACNSKLSLILSVNGQQLIKIWLTWLKSVTVQSGLLSIPTWLYMVYFLVYTWNIDVHVYYTKTSKTCPIGCTILNVDFSRMFCFQPWLWKPCSISTSCSFLIFTGSYT